MLALLVGILTPRDGIKLTDWVPATATWTTPETASDPGASAGGATLAANNTRHVIVWRDTRNSTSGEIFARVGARN